MMKKLLIVLGVAAAVFGCSRGNTLDIPKGREVTVQKRDGGAAKGAAIGGGAGTAVVLSTRGNDVRMGAGTPLSVKVTAPLTIRVPVT